MVEEVAFELRQSGQLTSTIAVKIRSSNFDTESKQKKIAYTANDNTIIETELSLFDALYQRRMTFRLVGIRFSGLIYGQPQIDLFEDTEEQIKLLQAIDKMKKRFGAHVITRAITGNAYRGK